MTTLLDDGGIHDLADRLAAGLAALGVRAGDTVAVCAGNTIEHVAAREAAARCGVWFVPVNPRLAPPEIERIVARSRAKLLLGDAGEGAEAVTFLDVVERGRTVATAPARNEAIGPTILFTSGTTGEPKGCVRTEEQERARADELIATYAITSSDVHLVACPLAHSAPGIFLRASRAAGARTALMPRFDAGSFVAAVAATRATLFFLVPTQIERLLALPAERKAAADWSSVRAFIVAGAPFPTHTKQRLLEWIGPGKLWEFYGASETGTVSVLAPDGQPGHAGLVGRPPRGVELRVLDAEGRPVAHGEVGELFVRSPSVMSGYLDGAGAEQWRDGFLSVGDLGKRSASGALTLVDRKHDTIISGGINVYPAEVERALTAHPAIASAVVCGVPDPDWGETVAALVAPRDGERVDPDALRSFLRGRIAGYKIPRRIEVLPLDEMPVGPSGKPLRRAARARFTAP